MNNTEQIINWFNEFKDSDINYYSKLKEEIYEKKDISLVNKYVAYLIYCIIKENPATNNIQKSFLEAMQIIDIIVDEVKTDGTDNTKPTN